MDREIKLANMIPMQVHTIAAVSHPTMDSSLMIDGNVPSLAGRSERLIYISINDFVVKSMREILVF